MYTRCLVARDRGPSCAQVVPCHRGTAWRHGIGPRRLNKACRRRLGGPYFRAVGPLAKIVVAKYLTPPTLDIRIHILYTIIAVARLASQGDSKPQISPFLL
jgi:hypothetical protein